jgi:integrase
MATIRKLRGKWQAMIRRKFAKPIYKTFTLKEDAHKWARQIETDIEKGIFQDTNEAYKVTLRAILLEYKDKVSILKKGYNQEAAMITKFVRNPLTDLPLAKVTASAVLDFRDNLAKDYKGATVNKYLNLISISMQYAERIKGIFLPHKPMTVVKRLRVDPFQGQVIEPNEEQLLLSKAEESKLYWLKCAIILGIDCGVRRGEIFKLKYQDIDFQKHTAILWDTKNGSNRTIGLSQRAVDELKKLPVGMDGELFRQKSPHTFRFYYRQLQRRTGIFKRFHDTRHTFATRRTNEGWSIVELSQQGGWKQLQVLKRYTHIKPESLAKKLG